MSKEIPIDHEYFVNPPLAIVSNKDMNIVYESIENTLNISMPGVSNENIEILSPPSIRKGMNTGEYIMVGEKGKNGKVRIKIKDKLLINKIQLYIILKLNKNLIMNLILIKVIL